MKKYFLTGLVVLLPVSLTFVIVLFFINTLTTPFVGGVKAVLAYYNILNNGFLFLSADQMQILLSQVLILLLLFVLISTVGWVARWVLFNYFLGIWQRMINRIPLIRTIYNTTQELINNVFASKSKSFKQVVMVPFPTNDLYGIGFVAKEEIADILGKEKKLTAVFLPTTPNPTSGFIILYNDDEVVYIDMKVEEALSYIMTCGMVSSPLAGDGKIDIAERLKKDYSK